ncbi:collagenase-like [Schistocerca serialis cubense]|uniref:collagenase-like n=1 Tax=Schistocerca serialis cubense TaxID=2023355 RepID=UPI00214E4949|nr:collagenase-like [Schistocerca serialis cubense]
MKKKAEGHKKRSIKDKADKSRNLQVTKVSKKKQTLYKKKHHQESESSSENDLNLDLQNICDDDEMDDIDPLAIPENVCLVCGEFGKDGELWYRWEDPSQTLQYTDVTVIPNSVCELDYKPGFIRESTLCAGNKNKGICSGDHGAPLVLKDSFKQIGIASFYYDKCEVPVPAGYTRVTYFLNWITRTAGIDID